MFASLRSRLWLTYSVLAAVALGVVALVLLIFLLTNPALYRQVSARMSFSEAAVAGSQTDLSAMTGGELQTALREVGESFETRILIFDANRGLIADSMRTEAAMLDLPRFPRLRPASATADENGEVWLYSLTRLRWGGWLMVAALRPQVPVLSLIRDQFFAPIVQAAIVSLALSIILAFWVAGWVAGPIRRLVDASHQLPDATIPPLVEQGPTEVKELVNAFNSMTARVQASQKSQRDFVANVSHEMKTPLTSIQGFAQAIADGTADTPDSQRQAAAIIYTEAGRMHRMVLDLLDLARLDSGTANLKSEIVDINSLLENIQERFALQARRAGIELDVASNGSPVVTGDGDRLAQVLTNLVDNAIQHSPRGAKVRISARTDSDQLILDVADRGEGIPPEMLPHIFDRFYRGDPSRQAGQDQGAGLGLAIAREIVLAHHGTITAQSAAGQGSTFTVCLPIGDGPRRKNP